MPAPNITQQDPARTLAAIRQLVEDVPRESAGPPGIHFKRMGVQPPSDLYLSIDDRITITVTSLTVIDSTAPLIFTARILQPDGGLHWFKELYTVPTVGISTHVVPVTEGFLLDTAVSCPNGYLTRGNVFVLVALTRNNDTAIYRTLIANYVTQTAPPVWPGGTLSDALDGNGQAWLEIGAAPAAGAEIVYTVPANLYFEVSALSFALVTSAAVANRQVSLVIDDGYGNVIYRTAPAAAVPLMTTATFSAAAGAALVGAGSITVLPLPAGLKLVAGYRIVTQTADLQAADQYSAINLFGQQWINNF